LKLRSNTFDAGLALNIVEKIKSGGSLFVLFLVMQCDYISGFTDENRKLINYIQEDFQKDNIDATHLHYNLMFLVTQLQTIEQMVALAMRYSGHHENALVNIIGAIDNYDKYTVPDYEGFGGHFSKSSNKKLKDIAPNITEHFKIFHQLLHLIKRTIEITINAESINDSQKSEETKSAGTYNSPYFNFSINYPLSWRVKENDGIVVFGSPQESGTDDFIENVNVVVEDLSFNPMTLNDYTTKSLMNFPKLLPNFELLQQGNTEIDNKESSFIVYSDRRGDLKAKFKAYMLISHDKAYVMTYGAKENEFNEYLPQAERTMQSIKIKHDGMI